MTALTFSSRVRNIEQVIRRLMVSARADAGWLAAIQDGSLTVSVALKFGGSGNVRSKQALAWRGAISSGQCGEMGVNSMKIGRLGEAARAASTANAPILSVA